MKKKKALLGDYVFMLCYLLIGAFCGFSIMSCMDRLNQAFSLSVPVELLILAALFVAMYLLIFAQIIIHEAGHLIFGLISGYKFSSFRIMNMMWLKRNGRIRFKRFSIAGTGGQCLMIPPQTENEDIPVFLYNLGGSIANMLSALIALIISFAVSKIFVLASLLQMLGVIGIAIAITNGVPLRLSSVSNDGYNALYLKKDPTALRSLKIQLWATEQLSHGVRLKDMPDEWFTVPDDEAMKNGMTAAMGVFACNRYVDECRFEEARSLIEHMLDIESGINGVHKNMLICDLIFIELTENKNRERASELLTKDITKFIKAMKTNPSVLRTDYTVALLLNNDSEKADKIKTSFEKISKRYPYPQEIDGERDLIAIADNVANSL